MTSSRKRPTRSSQQQGELDGGTGNQVRPADSKKKRMEPKEGRSSRTAGTAGREREGAEGTHSKEARTARALGPALCPTFYTSRRDLWLRSVLELHSTLGKDRKTLRMSGDAMTRDIQRGYETMQKATEATIAAQADAQEKVARRSAALVKRHWLKIAHVSSKFLRTAFEDCKAQETREKQELMVQESEQLTKQLVSSLHQGLSGAGSDSLTPSGTPFPPLTQTQTNGDRAEERFTLPLALLNTLNGSRSLRPYQQSALKWLIHLYENNLNGILADEMGLGKTVQTIALLCYYAEYKRDWGPHLIVVPTTVVLNWEMEFRRWAPGFKVITYIGTLKERAQLRKGWSADGAFNVCVTSYHVLMSDRNAFRRRPWGFLVIDEAHTIKNWKGKMWQGMFDLQTQHRLLLTGTPLQNSVMELWSLLRFLLPDSSTFEDDKEFQEWFSSPMDEMVAGRSVVSERLVQRLHSMLRPFMLRRLKIDVEAELPSKTEKVIMCRLSLRQHQMYYGYLRSSEARNVFNAGQGMFGVLMSMRKVCNHPDLFAERPIRTPFITQQRAPFLIQRFLPSSVFLPEFIPGYDCESHGVFEGIRLTALVHRRRRTATSASRPVVGALGGDPHHRYYSLPSSLCLWPHAKGLGSLGEDRVALSIALSSLMTRIRASGEPKGAEQSKPRPKDKNKRASGVQHSPGTVEVPAWLDPFLVKPPTVIGRTDCAGTGNRCSPHFWYWQEERACRLASAVCFTLPAVLDLTTRGNRTSDDGEDGEESFCLDLERQYPWLVPSIGERFEAMSPLLNRFCVYVPKVQAGNPPHLVCRRTIRYPAPFKPLGVNRAAGFISMCRPTVPRGYLTADDLKYAVYAAAEDVRRHRAFGRFSAEFFGEELWAASTRRCFTFPDKWLLLHDCGKFQVLATLLPKLQREGHRALIFTQFTKMLDLLEKFLALLGLTYLRIDGATKPDLRQKYVERYNVDSNIMAMILSTRSGGIGVNLVGADTVIFYDSDWNPAMDLQAQDRCHRIGQTRAVTIYRLISEGTVEEKILKTSRERKMLANVVIRGGGFHAGLHGSGGGGSGAGSAAGVQPFRIMDFFHDFDEDTDIAAIKEQGLLADREFNDEEAEAARRAAEDEEDRAAEDAVQREVREQDMENEEAAEGTDGGSFGYLPTVASRRSNGTATLSSAAESFSFAGSAVTALTVSSSAAVKAEERKIRDDFGKDGGSALTPVLWTVSRRLQRELERKMETDLDKRLLYVYPVVHYRQHTKSLYSTLQEEHKLANPPPIRYW